MAATGPATTATATHFDFLRLPPPVRNLIYRQALKVVGSIHIRLVIREGPRRYFRGEIWFSDSRPRCSRYPLNFFYTPALLFVNRQLYEEAIGILYDNNFILHGTMALKHFGDVLWTRPDSAPGRFLTQIRIEHLTAGKPEEGLAKLAACTALRSICFVIDSWGGNPPRGVVEINDAARLIYRTISPLLQPYEEDVCDKEEWWFQRLSFELPHGIHLSYEGCDSSRWSYFAALTDPAQVLLLEEIRKEHDRTCAKR